MDRFLTGLSHKQKEVKMKGAIFYQQTLLLPSQDIVRVFKPIFLKKKKKGI